MPTPRPRHWLLLALLVACYGSSFLLAKTALISLSPITIVFGRLALGALLLMSIAVLGLRLPIPRDLRALGELAFLALLGTVLPFILVTWGQEQVSSAMTGMLNGLMPILTIAFANFMLPDEPLTPRKAAGFLVGLIGAIFLIGPGALTGLHGHTGLLEHELAVLGSAAGYALTAVLMRNAASSVHPIMAGAIVCAFSALLTAPVALPGAIFQFEHAPLPALGAVAALGTVTATAGMLLFMLIRGAGASFTSLANYLTPVWAVLLGTTLGLERVAPSALVGLALVLSGVGIAELNWRTPARALKNI